MSPRMPVRRWLAASIVAVSLVSQSSAAAVGTVAPAVSAPLIGATAVASPPVGTRTPDAARELAVTARTPRPAERVATPVSVKPKATSKPKPAVAKPAPTKPRPTAAAPAYRGRNHVWIPALGINRSISFFPCSRSRPPDNYVYRWGCAGRNNVYLLGHAYSVFKPLHDAYVRGRLHKGMAVIYADGNGRVRTYRVSYWRVVSPVGADWAWAAQSRPSLTLQTCLGAQSQWRLIVRLVAA